MPENAITSSRISEDQLHICLADLESRLDEAQEMAHRQACLDFLKGQFRGEVFTFPQRIPAPAEVHWPTVSAYDALFDINAMLLSEFKRVSDILVLGGSACLDVRSNYGSAILPSVLGAEIFYTPELPDLLPNAYPLGGEGITRILQAGQPDLELGLGGDVLQAAEAFSKVMKKYPKIGRFVSHYHPDLQGPIDVLEILWGSDIFLAFFDEPQKIHEALEFITDIYIAFLRRWQGIVPPEHDWSGHWGMMIGGQVMLRNDSLMNLSPETYIQFIQPCDQRIFDEFDGGVVHFCGRGDHFIEPMSDMRGLTGIQLSQPEYNHMGTIYQHTVDKGIRLIGLNLDTAEKDIQAGRDFHHLVHAYPF